MADETPQDKKNGKRLNGNGKAKKGGQGQRRRTDYPNLVAPWPKGVSGNPGGMPKGSSVAGRIRRILAEKDGKVAEALAKVFIAQGIKADFKFAKEIIDRADGKVPDRIAGHDGGPLIREVDFNLDRV